MIGGEKGDTVVRRVKIGRGKRGHGREDIGDGKGKSERGREDSGDGRGKRGRGSEKNFENENDCSLIKREQKIPSFPVTHNHPQVEMHYGCFQNLIASAEYTI
ncbi:hypothetical protein PoB_004450800 [Plakobranchus ocellatus]|uniref:Uncharacterized protein n=1 Tax=Plakobranchus ocellatus TaxID=259542 RepID=A0AAV4BFS3_9GAST|nr:hypothetical protein PoB_004450800 [Plakobranchus ocellatus]